MSAQKQTAPPRLLSIIIVALLSLVLGVSLAFVSLATQTVSEVNALPIEKDRKPGLVYFVRGSEASASGWQGKHQAFISEQTGMIALDEKDLNQWSRRDLKLASNLENGPKLFDVEASRLNFRVWEDKIQLGTRVTIPAIGARQFIFQVRGRIENTVNGPEFVIENGSFGRAPIGKIPVLNSLFTKFILSKYIETEAFQKVAESFSDLNEVIVENGRLGLVRS